MEWTEPCIIIDTRPFGENKTIATVLTESQGLWRGIIGGHRSHGNKAKTNTSYGTSPFVQPGTYVQATWKARLPNHLGTFKLETISSPILKHIGSPLLLGACQSLFGLYGRLLPLGHPYGALFEALHHFLERAQENSDWGHTYTRLELLLLKELGYGLSLTQCAVTGQKKNLRFVSPRTGCAVSEKGAGPYAPRLLLLPPYMQHRAEDSTQDPTQPASSLSMNDLLMGLRLTGYFIDLWLCRPVQMELPKVRQIFMNRISAKVQKDKKEQETEKQCQKKQ